MADVELNTLGAVIKTAYEAESDTNAFTDAEKTKLSGIEAAADVTDTANVAAAGAVMASAYNANTILAANDDDTPVALTVAEQRIVGRITGGNITGLTATQIRTLLNVADGAEANTVDSDPTGISGADQVVNMMSLTTAEYTAIGTPNVATLFFITDA